MLHTGIVAGGREGAPLYSTFKAAGLRRSLPMPRGSTYKATSGGFPTRQLVVAQKSHGFIGLLEAEPYMTTRLVVKS